MIGLSTINELCDIKRLSSINKAAVQLVPYLIYQDDSLLSTIKCLKWIVQHQELITRLKKASKYSSVLSDERFIKLERCKDAFRLKTHDAMELEQKAKLVSKKVFINNELTSSPIVLADILRSEIIESRLLSLPYVMSNSEVPFFLNEYDKCSSQSSEYPAYFADLITYFYSDLLTCGSFNEAIAVETPISTWTYCHNKDYEDEFVETHKNLLREIISDLDLNEFDESSYEEIEQKILNNECLSEELSESIEDVESFSYTQENIFLFIKSLDLSSVELCILSLIASIFSLSEEDKPFYYSERNLIIPVTIDYDFSQTINEIQFVSLIMLFGKVIETFKRNKNANICNQG